MKFETKIKLRSGQFAAMYQVIAAAETYYFKRANSKGDLQILAQDILYWRIISGIKSKLDMLTIKYKNRLVTEINFKLNDIETICLTNAVIPGLNNSYNDNMIAQIRDSVYRSTYQHVLNIFPSPAFSTGQPKAIEKTGVQNISISEAKGWLLSCVAMDIYIKIFAECTTSTGIETVEFQNIDHALEDGTRKSLVFLQIEDIGVFQIEEKSTEAPANSKQIQTEN